MSRDRRYQLFVCSTMLAGEVDHELLADAKLLGSVKTKPIYKLVEIRATGGLIEHGDTAVVGELYELDVRTLAQCDLKREHPVLFERRTVELSDGSRALAYFLRPEQVVGCRRVRDGDWRARFSARRPAEEQRGPFVRWARSRYSRK